VAGVCAGTTVIALEEPQPEIGLGIRLAFEIVSRQSSNAVVGKRGTQDEPRLEVAMRQLMEDVMAKVIEFYIPDSFTRKVNCLAPNERGKVIEFPSPKKKSA
jgi:hypothetical protein